MIEENVHDQYSQILLRKCHPILPDDDEMMPVHLYHISNGATLYFVDIGRPTAEIDVDHTWGDMAVYRSPPRSFQTSIGVKVEVKVLVPEAFMLVTQDGEMLFGSACAKAALEQIALEEAYAQLHGSCDNLKMDFMSRLNAAKEMDSYVGGPPHLMEPPVFLSPWKDEE